MLLTLLLLDGSDSNLCSHVCIRYSYEASYSCHSLLHTQQFFQVNVYYGDHRSSTPMFIPPPLFCVMNETSCGTAEMNSESVNSRWSV